MGVKIRLRRAGKKKQPFYRVVVADSRSPRDGKCIEELGYYNPMTQPEEIKIDLEKVRTWISNGAQPTPRVRSVVQKAENPEETLKVKAPKKSKKALKKEEEAKKAHAEREKKDAEAAAAPKEENPEAKETETENV